MTTPKLEIRPANPTAEAYADITLKCFGASNTAAYYQWKYRDNPAGEVIAYEAWDAEKECVAAFYGIIPQDFVVNGEVVRFYQSMDTMTHPDYQRRGLFVQLAEQTYEALRKQGPLRLIGIPGPTSYPGFVHKLGWTGDHFFTLIFLPKPIHSLLGLTSDKGYTAEPITSLAPIEGWLAKPRTQRLPIEPLKSAAYLDWRLLQHPTLKYDLQAIRYKGEVIGFGVLRDIDSKRVHIEGLEVDDPRHFRGAVQALSTAAFARYNKPFVYTWQPIDPLLRAAYKKAGFLFNPLKKGPFSYRIPLILKAEPDSLAGVPLLKASSYAIQPYVQD